MELQSLITKGNASSTTQTVDISSAMNGQGIIVSGPENEQGFVVAMRYDPKHYEVPISHGENGGRTLPHGHVVKDVRQLGNWTGGSKDFELPHWDADGLKVAVLVHAGLGVKFLGRHASEQHISYVAQHCIPLARALHYIRFVKSAHVEW